MDEVGEIDTSFMNSDERAGWNELMEVIKMENHSSPNSPDVQMMSNQMQPATPAKPFLRIVEQPAPKALRFRYECEGRSAGSIPGVSSTPENKTFPTIEICNYDKDAVIVVSCVTKDPPYRPHPHKVVGRDGGGQKYDKGICEVKLKGAQGPLRAVFNNLGIQCVKRREVATSLKLRREYKINPFSVPYPSNDQKSTYDLNVVRLCFQGFINPTGQRWEPLQPQISNPIFDKKGVFELKICQLCSCSGRVNGGDRIILLCEKVDKNDIKIKFSECNNEGEIKWAAYADFQQQDIHKQTAIVFKTPRYERTDITEAVKVYIQLERPSDGGLSEPLEFEYYPDPGMRTFTRIRRKIKHKEQLDIFQQILSLDSETTATKYSCPETDFDARDDANDDTVSSDSSASKPNSPDTLNEYDAEIQRRVDRAQRENEMLRRNSDNDIELEVPQIRYPIADDSTQTSTPMEEILEQQRASIAEARELSPMDKITEWMMRSSEFERTDSLTVENGDSTTPMSPVTVCTNPKFLLNRQTTISPDEDKTFTELIGQLTEFDDSQSRRDTLDNPIIKDLPIIGEVADETQPLTVSTHPSVDIDENFDETTTYTSLKISLKNPIDIPMKSSYRKSSQSSSVTGTTEEDLTDLVVLTNPPAPKIQVNSVRTPPSPVSPPLPVPPRTPSPGPEQKGPPLPPKRRISHEINSTNTSSPRSSISRARNGSLPVRPSSQIIIMRTPDQSPTKRQQCGQATPTASPKKKQGFFSRLFSRKSKSNSKNEPSPASAPHQPEPPTIMHDSTATTPTMSREPSIGNFSLADPHRSSMRSSKSLQPHSPGLSPHSSTNISIRSTGDHLRRKRLRTDKSKEDISALKKNLQSDGFLIGDINGQYQTPSLASIVNNLETTANAFTLPQFKAEPVASPEYYAPHLSPGGMIHSPVPQPSPIGAMQYTTLQPSIQNTNQFLSQTTTSPSYPSSSSSPWNQLPTMSGGNITLIRNDQQTTNHTITTATSNSSHMFTSNFPMEMDNSNATIGMNSEERIEIVNQFIAGIFSNAINDNTTGTEIPPLPEVEEGLTASGLLTELDGQQLMEIASLSVSGET